MTSTTVPRPMNIPQRTPDEGSWNVFLGYARYLCSICNCTWDGVDHGSANLHDEWCDKERCACHDPRFAAAVYEG